MMRIGLHIPNGQAGANADDILKVALAAERSGFDSLWMFDHLFTPTDLESLYPYSGRGQYALNASDPFFDPLALFGIIAGVTERISIGTGVLIAAYRHPIVLGKILASVENFAPGRVILGLGTGWMREEFDALGISFEKRGKRLDEYIAALRTLWSPEPSSFEGEFYGWQEAGFLPPPTRPIPLIIGGHSKRALRRAATLGDGWALVTRKEHGAGLEGASVQMDNLNRALEEAGRGDAEGFQVLYQHALWISDEANPRIPLTGPPDVIAGSLKSLQEMGVTHVDLMVLGPGDAIMEMAERFNEEVRPLL